MSEYHLIRDLPRLEIKNGVHILEYKLEVVDDINNPNE